jgi:hypothetical protein
LRLAASRLLTPASLAGYVAEVRGKLSVPDESESLGQEAREMGRLTPAERVRLFCSIMRMIQMVWISLPFEERLRRIRIAEGLEPSPRPWWRGLRSAAPR